MYIFAWFYKQMEEPLTVESFLNSLGLGKYFLAFKREEVSGFYASFVLFMLWHFNMQ